MLPSNMLPNSAGAVVRAAIVARRVGWQVGLIALLAVVFGIAARERLVSASSFRVIGSATQSSGENQPQCPDSEVPLPVDESPQAETDGDLDGGMDQLVAPVLLVCKPVTAAHPCRWGPCYCATPKEFLHTLQ